MTFIAQDFQKLQSEHDEQAHRHTDRHTDGRYWTPNYGAFASNTRNLPGNEIPERDI